MRNFPNGFLYFVRMNALRLIFLSFFGMTNLFSFAQNPVGEQDVTTLDWASYAWYQPEFDAYKVEKEESKLLKKKLKGVQMVLVMGFWCEDSQREIPRFMKLMSEIKYKKLRLLAVDESKEIPGMTEYASYEITHVPTLILYKNGKELGRIIERPAQTLEKDLLDILTP